MDPNFEKLKGKLEELHSWKDNYSRDFAPFFQPQEATKLYEDLGGYRHATQVVKQILV